MEDGLPLTMKVVQNGTQIPGRGTGTPMLSQEEDSTLSRGHRRVGWAHISLGTKVLVVLPPQTLSSQMEQFSKVSILNMTPG